MTRLLAVAVVIHWLTTPARALDCSRVTIAVGQPLDPVAAECLRASVVATELRAARCEAQLATARTETEACQATAAITCPPPEPPVVPVVIASLVGVVVGVVATVALVLSVPR